MGDGGVACMPLHRIMERFPIENKLFGINNGAGSGVLGSLEFAAKRMKLQKEPVSEKKKVDIGGRREKIGGVEVNNDEVRDDKLQREEVEEGELGTLKWPKGEQENVENVENAVQKPQKGEDEREFLPEKWGKEETEGATFVSEKWKNGDVENGEIILENAKIHETEKLDSGPGKSIHEAEKGEFIPERCQKWEAGKDECSIGKSCSYDAGTKEKKEWKYESERTPPHRKHSSEGKDISRNESQHGRRSFSRLDIGQEKDHRFSSKTVDMEGSFKSEHNNGKNYDRELLSGNRLKRHTTDSEGGDRKHHTESVDNKGSKSRRISDGGMRTVHSTHRSRRAVEKSFRNSSSSRNPYSDRYSSRHHDSSFSSKAGYERHGRSPDHSERFHGDRSQYRDHKDRSPAHRDRSPYVRSHRRGRRNRSPDRVGRSPQDCVRHQGCKDHTPNYLELSPPDARRHDNTRETSKKSEAGDRRHCLAEDRDVEDRSNARYSTKKVINESQNRSSVQDVNGSAGNLAELSQSSVDSKEPLWISKVPEEPTSMEEDMDICNTPPHVPVVADSTAGKWFYLDHLGAEKGPSKLSDLKRLVEEGVLVPDHLIKHEDSHRWLTVESATSPLVTVSFLPIVPDSVTHLVNPPEAPGNLLTDTGDVGQFNEHFGEEESNSLPLPQFFRDNSSSATPLEDFYIDERVNALLEGFTISSGKELEAIGEALKIPFDHVIDGLGNSEGNPGGQLDQRSDYPSNDSESMSKDVTDFWSNTYSRKAFTSCSEIPDWFSGLWSCKGGDWRRNDELLQDRSSRKKLVLNNGYPLCQMPKSGCKDPRWLIKDELYYPSHNQRLDLPPWAFSLPEEVNECNGVGKTTQMKPVAARPVKGMAQSVTRINACVVKDHGSFVSEPRAKVRVKERCSSRSARSHPSTGDLKRTSVEGDSSLMTNNEQHFPGASKCPILINTPKDHVCQVDELQLHLGDWYYLDGVGREHGPLQFSELQVLVDQGRIMKNSSIYRKFDKVWVPVNSSASHDTCDPPFQLGTELVGENIVSRFFHDLHPQFIGFTRGKLHELVMKSYKSREFAAAVNEVLDPWLSAKQPKKEMEKYVFNPSTNKRSDNEVLSAKGTQMSSVQSEDDCEMEQVSAFLKNDFTFDDLCSDATFYKDDSVKTELGTWGLLNGHLLARVFHMLRSDIKSIVFASLTCRDWRAAAMFYKDISRHVDLSSIGSICTDSMVRNILNGYKKENVTSMALNGCDNITSSTVEEIFRLFPHLTFMDIRGCTQLEDLTIKFPNVSWVKSHSSVGVRNFEEPCSKIRNLNQLSVKALTVGKNSEGVDGQMDDFSELRDYFDSVDKRDAANKSFRGSLYKRSKLFDARKSSSILSRDARIRHWAMKKSDNGYKWVEEFIALGLKNIMKENTFDFFVPKVAEIERRMMSGYYASHGLKSVKEDISGMCRDAIKVKSQGDVGDMNCIIKSFIQLATHLEDNLKSSHQRAEMMKMWKNDFSGAFSSSKYKMKSNKLTTDRKFLSKGSFMYTHDGLDHREYVSDREVRRSLSKLNKKSMDSVTESSDDLNGSSEDSRSDSPSDAYCEMVFQSDRYLMADSLSHDREWGARMTKASLVPPVTRKYEVIDHYVIVADEEDVQRKMQVSLPEDYAEKLCAQKNGNEESDMEIPEVKGFKPRKELGNEVIEQEVYGIDPYTHNLLLDSMPRELDWPLLEKDLFIEDMLLRTLNKQVRCFTGTGNTPMMHPLQSVVEEIQKFAEEDRDMRVIRMCQGVLKSMASRPDDNYVAYRKGLGVVCNKDDGFSEDDFIVEFLGEVYPAWKWFEKQDGIRSLQENEDPASEFYNIYLERPKGDADGYDLVVVDAMHKANFASRICHSCRPNCEAKVTCVNGKYQIGIYSLRPIHYGEEITFDYNSVTESKEEHEVSVCLCGSQVCRGSYLNLTGEGAFYKVLKECHGILHRHQLMLEACELNSVSEEDYIDLGKAGLGSCLLGGLPDWAVSYAARLVRYINFERTKHPEVILQHNLEEKRKYFAEICIEVEKSDAEVQAEGVYNQRLQNLTISLDKVRYVMRCVFGDAKKAPPPLERLSPEAMVLLLWEGEGSLVEELLQCMAPHMEVGELEAKIRARDPLASEDILGELQRSLLWLRDELRSLPCTYKCRHDAAADLIHIYAYTRCFFRIQEYGRVTSPAVYISPLDLGPKHSDKLSGGFEYHKTYGANYCLGQLMNWYNQTNTEPDCVTVSDGRGCLHLPEIGSFYSKANCVYGQRTLRSMLAKMEKQPQRAWPEEEMWRFQRWPRVVGSPMLDAVLQGSALEKEMVQWLKSRPPVWDP